ncbi:GntR family transcriptional regulator [Puniceicoccus vermicola]|uniref:GntR family transcriptional regulator n=1 Tax=Puniceicoccus vermicola TaxID=388746 RepID=A0A7X1AYY1_9BACT|nr:GntR family transcriptional regulator [Puniceicoccus vermicola]MBC2602543.1 GntR family transcriptional regulator [Puniceicoccus vermicola]
MTQFSPNTMLKTIQRKPSLSGQVAEALRHHVKEELEPGAKLEAESKLAKRFGVSVMTVREAFATLASEGLIERIHGSGTFVRDPRESLPVALVMTWDLYSSRASYFHMRVFQKVQELLEAAGIPVVTFHEQVQPPQKGDRTPEKAREAVYNDRSLRGFVFISTNPPPALLTEEKRKERYVYGFGTQFNRHLQLDPEAMLRMALRYFKSNRRKKIAVIAWRELFKEGSGMTLAERIFAEEGFPFYPEWFHDQRTPASGDAGWQQFRSLWGAFPRKKPDGLLLMDDILYAQASQAILNESIDVPNDLLVVSQSNQGSGMFLPFPTTLLEFKPDILAEAVAGEVIAEHTGTNPYRQSLEESSRLELIDFKVSQS